MSPARHSSEEPETIRRFLRERAVELARPPRPDEASEQMEVLRFRAAGAWCALDQRYVCEILSSRPLYPLPGLPGFVAGVIDVRAQLWSVLHTAAVLGLRAESAPAESRVLLLADDRMEFGLCVEEVEGIVALPSSEIHAPAASRETSVGRYLLGIHRSGTYVLDGSRMLSDPALVVSQ